MLCREPEERLFYGEPLARGPLPVRGRVAGRTSSRSNRFRVDDGRASRRRKDGRDRRAFAIPTRRSSDDADLLALDRITMAEWLDGERLHVEAPALARRVRLPRRLRDEPRQDLRVGRHPLQRGAPARRGRGRGAVGLPDVARGERPPRRGISRRAAAGRIDAQALVFDVGSVGRRRSARAPALPGREDAARSSPSRRRRRSSRSRSTRRATSSRRGARRRPRGSTSLSYAPWLVANVTLSGRPKETRASRSRGTTSSTTRARSATSSRRTRPARTTARRS